MNRIIYEIDHVSQLYKRGKVKANDDISFTIQEGEILGILGPNGAGKSTLIKQIIGHLKPTEGNVRFMGTDVYKQANRVAEQVAYYAQEPTALESLKAFEALTFTGRLRGMPNGEAARQANDLLEMMGISDFRSKQLKHLSGGQRRMIGLGTVLIGQLPFLILDEPTNELDPKNRRLIWNIIKERNSQGATIVLVTHNVLEAEQVVDRIAVVNHGKLLAIDSVSKLKQNVDQRLKFELTTPFNCREAAINSMSRWGQIQVTGEHRITLFVDKSIASQVLDFMIHNPEMPIEEYAVKPPSLEDVYFHIDEQVEQEVLGA